jgi:hypothetical protein
LNSAVQDVTFSLLVSISAFVGLNALPFQEVNTLRIDLLNSHQIELSALKQFRTYAGLLEGLPTLERNQELLQRLIVEQTKTDQGYTPFLIEPAQIPYPPSVADGYPFGTPMRLPKICCIGQFHSSTPARKANADYSLLTIIWFQQTWALPIDETIIEVMTLLAWSELAHDSDY